MEETRYFRSVTPELKNFWDNIDWTPFREFTLKEYGFDHEPDHGLKGGGYSNIRPFVRVPENLRDRCGLFAKVYSKVFLEELGSGICRKVLSYDEEKYRDFIRAGNFSFSDEDICAKLSPIRMWVTMHLRYEYVDGGRNGSELFSCQYTEAEGWLFHKVGE